MKRCSVKLSVWLPVAVITGLVLILGTAGCSTFNSEWKKAARAAPAEEITGRWEGSWRSERNGHHGSLRCVITRTDGQLCRARYKATWWKVFRFGYTVTMHVEKTATAFRFQGEADLGWMAGGHYDYAGEATSTTFSSTYKSKHDHGVFEMRRP